MSNFALAVHSVVSNTVIVSLKYLFEWDTSS